jgi:hypothetical protein
MDVQGWITLTNNSGTPYTNASVLLVAGAVGRGMGRSLRPPSNGAMERAGTETAGRERLGDFYLYPLAERTTVAHRQVKQVSFLDVAGTPATRAYEFSNDWLGTRDQPVSAQTVLRFSSSRDQGLGDALPAGNVRVYQRDARGNPQFVGEAAIGHTPMGSELGLVTGEAFDVRVHPIVERRERSSDRWRTTMRYTLSNAGPQPIVVILRQGGLWGDTRIAQESLASERVSADEALWRVTVPANGETVVTATFDTRY